MKIKVRIPTETYAYTEVEYDSLEEYKTQHPEFAKVLVQVKQKAITAAKEMEVPFKGDEYAKQS